MTWSVVRVHPGVVHVVPDEDLVVHERERCVCVPAVECVRKEGQPDGWLYTHHSLDGREQSEMGGESGTAGNPFPGGK